MDESSSNSSNKSVTDGVIGKASETYNRWNESATVKKEDSTAVVVFKLTIRILGIILLVALSPIALVVLFIAFLTVL